MLPSKSEDVGLTIVNVIDVPQAANRALYDEAITQYAQLVRPRARAIYHVGHVRYPGLSDIDLLVVTDRIGIDNRYYFSALHRLPRRFHSIFLHEPFILPAWSLRAVQYTTHYSPTLVAGRDVLHSYMPGGSQDERWCRMLEAYCSYAGFVARTQESGTLKGRLTVSVATAFCHTLADAAQLLAFDAQTYAHDVDSIRSGFFERTDPASEVRAAWDAFAASFERFDEHLRAWLGSADREATVAEARALVRGEETCDAFDREYAFRRARDIDGYHQELASLGFPYGHLFFIAAHPGAVRRLPGIPVLTSLVRNIYRVRQSLTEYVTRA